MTRFPVSAVFAAANAALVGLLFFSCCVAPGTAIISQLHSIMKTSNPISQYLYKAGANLIDSQSLCCPKYGCYSTAVDWLGWTVAELKPPVNFTPSTNTTTICDVEVTVLFNQRGTNGPNTTDDIFIDAETANTTVMDNWLKNVAGFNVSRERTVFIFPGFANRAQESYYTTLRDAVLEAGDFNVFRIDFPFSIRTPYVETRIVAAKVANFIARLVQVHGLDYTKKVHFIGFSVGSHLAGFTSKAVTKILQQKSKAATAPLAWKITGLDPGPFFGHAVARAFRLDTSDAQYVEVLHTGAGGVLGDREPMGHVDYYFNGGWSLQPDCSPSLLGAAAEALKSLSLFAGRDFIGCSHIRAVKLYAEILRRSTTSQQQCKFIGNKCASYEDYNSGKCMGCSNSGAAKVATGTSPVCSELTMNTHRHSIALGENLSPTTEFTPLSYHMYTIGEAGGFCAHNLLLELDLVADNSTAAYFDVALMVELSFKGSSTTLPTTRVQIPVQVSTRAVGNAQLHRQRHVLASPRPLNEVRGIKLWWVRPEELSLLQKLRLNARERLVREEKLFREVGLEKPMEVDNSTTIAIGNIMLKDVLELANSASVLSGRNVMPAAGKVKQNEFVTAELARGAL